MKTLQLTDKDYQALCMMMGYTAGAHAREGTPLPAPYREITDWILIQGSSENYTYYFNRNTLAKQKRAEIDEEEQREADRRG